MTDKPANTNANRGYLAALVSTLFLATTAIFIRYLALNFKLPALVLTFWRELFVACFLLLFFLLFKPTLLKGARPHLPYLAAYGLVLALFNGSWTLSVALNGASVATVLVYSSAAFTAVLGWLILKEKLGLAKIIAVILSLAGCALVANALDPKLWALNASGVLVGVLAGLAYAVYSLMGRSASQRGLNPWTTLFFIFGIASIFLLVANLGFGRLLPGGAARPADLFWLGNSLSGWSVLLTLAAIPTLLGFGLYNVSLKHLPSSVANLIMTSEPVFTAIIAFFMFGEMLSPIQIAGSAIILVGVALIRLTGK
ncbi:MAG: DMT family transporter [Pelolinea sp.]|nr:DMT family transporter [Pelolinea sp.]